jgi:hypothetical protein
MDVKKIFLKQIEDFTEEMINIFPEIKSLQVFKTQYEVFKSMNSTLIIENFIKYVLPHKDKILKEDEAFFLNGGGQENVKGELMKFANVMADIWMNKMSEENKQIAWKYFKVFVILSEKYMEQNKQISS